MAFLVSWTAVGRLDDRLRDLLPAGALGRSPACCVAAVVVVESGAVAEEVETRFEDRCWHTAVEAVEVGKSHGWQVEVDSMEAEGMTAVERNLGKWEEVGRIDQVEGNCGCQVEGDSILLEVEGCFVRSLVGGLP